MQRYVGFYWTLPVNWADFRKLPKDAAQAATKSTTIRYQRELIQRWVRDTRGEVADEIVYISPFPDRATDDLLEAVRKAGEIVTRMQAILIMVRFGEYDLWRRINGLSEMIAEYRLPIQWLPPDPILIDGSMFDPSAHFKTWRAEDRQAKAEMLRQAMKGFSNAVKTFGESRPTTIADWLNAEGIRTPTGRKWSVDNVRKVIERGSYLQHR